MKSAKILAVSFLMVSGLIVILTGNSYAGSVTSYITNIDVADNNIASVTLVDPMVNSPACSTNSNVVCFYVDTSKGQAMLAVFLTAHSTNKQVVVFGKDSCLPVWGLWPCEEVFAVAVQP